MLESLKDAQKLRCASGDAVCDVSFNLHQRLVRFLAIGDYLREFALLLHERRQHIANRGIAAGERRRVLFGELPNEGPSGAARTRPSRLGQRALRAPP